MGPFDRAPSTMLRTGQDRSGQPFDRLRAGGGRECVAICDGVKYTPPKIATRFPLGGQWGKVINFLRCLDAPLRDLCGGVSLPPRKLRNMLGVVRSFLISVNQCRSVVKSSMLDFHDLHSGVLMYSIAS